MIEHSVVSQHWSCMGHSLLCLHEMVSQSWSEPRDYFISLNIKHISTENLQRSHQCPLSFSFSLLINLTLTGFSNSYRKLYRVNGRGNNLSKYLQEFRNPRMRCLGR